MSTGPVPEAAILEVAILDVLLGETAAFEAAFETARPIIEGMHGFRGLELRRCVESSHRYVLLVGWERLEDHTEGFRRSEGYERWRELLHHFYDPFPSVEHYEPVVAPPPPG